MTQSRTALYHFSYHKCLTVFFKGVMVKAFAAPAAAPRFGYTHVNSRLDLFHELRPRYRLISVNNHFVDPAELATPRDFRASRFVRDPRDLLVSGYLYHKRGTEKWLHVRGPRDADWAVVNGRVPTTMPADTTYTEYLNAAPTEEGLLAELEFRADHFDGMARWPQDDPRILTIRYEDLLHHEAEQYGRIFDHYGVGAARKAVGLHWAQRNSASGKRAKSDAHVRDPRPRQWENVLTPRVLEQFDRRHPGLLSQYGYA